MELEQQVCSLELAKRLKELGVEQHSCFYWHECSYYSAGHKRWWILDHQGDLCILDSCSAFTVAELGTILPYRIIIPHNAIVSPVELQSAYSEGAGGRSFGCVYHSNSNKNYFFIAQWAETEAESRAKMLIYLLENKLI